MIEKTPIPEVWKDTENPKIENLTSVFLKKYTVDGSELQRSPVEVVNSLSHDLSKGFFSHYPNLRGLNLANLVIGQASTLGGNCHSYQQNQNNNKDGLPKVRAG